MTHFVEAKEARVEKVGKSSKSSKGGRGKSNCKSISKGKGDPLKQLLVSRTQCRLCAAEGHWEEDCPQADVDMPQAKRRVTFSRPLVGVGVSQAWGVETWTVSSLTENAETRLKSWTSQEFPASTNLMGVTMTVPEGRTGITANSRRFLIKSLLPKQAFSSCMVVRCT